MAQKMLENMKVISEISDVHWTLGITDQIFTVIARVDGIEQEAGWFYATCSQCSKMVDVFNGAFWCSICNGLVRYPMIRFRVHLRVQDDTGETIFAMYNSQMEKLIDSSAHKLVNRLGIGNNAFPVEICGLSGKTFAFNIKLPDYFNPDYDFHHHRVVRLSEIECTLPADLTTHRTKKVWMKKSQPAPPVVDSGPMASSNGEPCGTEESTCASGAFG